MQGWIMLESSQLGKVLRGTSRNGCEVYLSRVTKRRQLDLVKLREDLVVGLDHS